MSDLPHKKSAQGGKLMSKSSYYTKPVSVRDPRGKGVKDVKVVKLFNNFNTFNRGTAGVFFSLYKEVTV